ncbi:Het-C-domain-containing protein [Mycena alexandri]|uniref:Het-C-domain-containing protein n=1 Tax=Mycena alexandri TaxID=1745969 RepID=A0AAD6TJC7_9AGAR|nr:Het-C-domain-containing protein [Mycena alexandri]
MTGSPSLTTTLLILTVVVLVLLPEVRAFGAGDIPDFAFLNNKAFRHGDIENILSTLAKTAGHAAAASGHGGNLFGFAKSMIQAVASGPGGPKFTSGDIKKVYFGNWLRDYSQAMDIGGLSKLTAESLVLVVSVLGFMASACTFGFATEEFQVTPERLGVYLPVEHIDNPKGYGANEGDPRQFHPKLRPPVNPRELEIDLRTGMKNYMASENQGWDTSTAHIRRVLIACIEMGRRAQGRDGPDRYEAYRLLGTGLHTLEDLLAHSNWVEIALRKMGHSEVFCHVGDATEIDTPNGRAPPLVTGTFGGADFLHSLMGEATDKLSQASVTDLATKMNQAQEGDSSNVSALHSILSKLPIGGGDSKMEEGEQLHQESKAYSFDPNNIAPPDVQDKLLRLLKWRDGLMRSILEKIEMIPGLDSLIDQLSNALNAYVYTVIAPWITPVLQQATSVLGEGSKAVINSEDQFEVFTNPHASDPSHSLLSKDHFGLILNEPAGKIAVLVVEHSVKIIVQAWSDNNDPSRAVDQILEAFHHPYYATGRSGIQNAMFEEMQRWLGGLEEDEARETIEALTKESVRNGKNKRLGSENEDLTEAGYGGCGHGHGAQPQRSSEQSYGGQQQQQQYEDTPASYSSGYGRQNEEYNSSRRNEDEYSRNNNEYSRETENYGRTSERDEYSRNEGDREEGYTSRRRDADQDPYGGRTERQIGGGYAPSYDQPEERSSSGYEYESRRAEQREAYGGSGNEYESRSSGYGRSEEEVEVARESYESPGRGGPGYERTEEVAEERYEPSGGYESTGRGGGSDYERTEERERGYGQDERTEEVVEERYEPSGGYESTGRGGSDYERTEERERGYGQEEETQYGRETGYTEERVEYQEASDETFGAERLNINEEEEQGYERREEEYEY